MRMGARTMGRKRRMKIRLRIKVERVRGKEGRGIRGVVVKCELKGRKSDIMLQSIVDRDFMFLDIIDLAGLIHHSTSISTC